MNSASEEKLAFSGAFRRAIEDRQVSMSWLHERLTGRGTPVSLATLSYWRAGRTTPERATSIDAVATIEQVLDLPRGYLLDRLSPSRRTPPLTRLALPSDVAVSPDALQTTLKALDFSTPQDEFTEKFVLVTMDFEPDGKAQTLKIVAELKAVVAGARRFLFIFAPDEDNPGEPSPLQPSGCEMGRAHFDREHLLYGFEFVVDADLQPGDAILVEYGVRMPPSVVTARSFIGYFAIRRIANLILRAQLAPGRSPIQVEAFETIDGRDYSRPLEGSLSAHTLHRHLKAFGPGAAGIRWRWTDAPNEEGHDQ